MNRNASCAAELKREPNSSTSRIAGDRACICLPQLRRGKGSFQLFVEGEDLYDAMIPAIESAQSEVRFESFIFAADTIGRRFAEALGAKARSGVRVRASFDSRGAAFRASPELYGRLVEHGVEIHWYHSWSWRHPTRYLRRNHRKLLVIDEREAFLGGFNIRLENSRKLYGEGRQRDTHVSVRGELARLAALLFDRMWSDSEKFHLAAVPQDPSRFEGLLVPNFSRRCQKVLACLYAGLLRNSSEFVYMTSPYFGPGTDVERAMREAALRGVDVRLLLPRYSDPHFVGWTTRSAYEDLLAAGVKIYEYLPRKLHAKTSVIDGEWSIVGSANLDYLSLFVNHELVLFARDEELGEALRAQYHVDLRDSEQVLLPRWRRRGRRERFLEMVGRAARRLF